MAEQECVYVIWVEFDDEFTKFLNKKCEELDKCGITQGIRPPHMTLTFVRTSEEEKLIQYTESFIRQNSASIMIKEISRFSSRVTYYAPEATNELMKLQEEFCKGVLEFGKLEWDLYYPEKWVPHIAMTGELDEDMSEMANLIMRDDFSETNALIKKVVIKRNGELLSEIFV